MEPSEFSSKWHYPRHNLIQSVHVNSSMEGLQVHEIELSQPFTSLVYEKGYMISWDSDSDDNNIDDIEIATLPPVISYDARVRPHYQPNGFKFQKVCNRVRLTSLQLCRLNDRHRKKKK